MMPTEPYRKVERGPFRALALTREVSPAIGRGERTHLAREPIDLPLARRQHAAYEEQLERLGCEVRRLPADPELADSVFVEDAAVVLDELAVITRPGAAARRPETAAIAEALSIWRPLGRIEPPGTLDGGDLLRVGRRLFVGLSSRTNREGLGQIQALASPYGYEVTAVPVGDCLHLKSAATAVGHDTLLVQPAWIERDLFRGLKLIETDPNEPFGANALLVGETVLYPEAYPRTRSRMEARGIRVAGVGLSELAKAEGGVTCCSLIVESQAKT